MHEVDQGPGGAAARLVVQQPQALGAQLVGRGDHVVDGVGDLLDPGPAALAGTGRWPSPRQRGQQLDLGAAGPDLHHRFPHALVVVGLDVDAPRAERALVERNGLVQVGDRHPHVVDAREHHDLRRSGCRWWPVSLQASQPDIPGGSHGYRSVIVAGARTPMGRLLGWLKDLSAAELGGVAIKSALERAGVAPDQVDYVIMGQVTPGRHRSDHRAAGGGRRRASR